AKAAGIPYVEMSEALQTLRRSAPALEWFYHDGNHPGNALVLLDAVLLYKQLFGAYPSATGFAVNAPIYTNESGLTETLRAADAPPPRPETPPAISYATDTIQKVIAGLRKQEGS
ncbi:MAG TPA: hypothetical protein VN599_10275, partial [Rudaea sp.]|nr:hypothetical protein [Rudaea sp.]